MNGGGFQSVSIAAAVSSSPASSTSRWCTGTSSGMCSLRAASACSRVGRPSPSCASHQRRYSGQVSSNSAFQRASGRSSSTPMNRSVRVCGLGAGDASSQWRHCFGIHWRQSYPVSLIGAV